MFKFCLVVTLCALGLNLNVAATKSNEGSVYDMPESCKQEGKSFCFEKGDNYPVKIIDMLLEDMRMLPVQKSEPPVSIGSRVGDSYDEPDCPSYATNKPIYYIYDTNGKPRVVVQSPKKFEQIYHLKWCTQEGRITKDTPHFLQSTTLQRFNLECVTTTSNIEFFVLTEGAEPMIEIARVKGGIPVCCKCRYNTDF